MHNLYKVGEYHWALFVGHLVIEKLLKAIYVEKKVERLFPRAYMPWEPLPLEPKFLLINIKLIF